MKLQNYLYECANCQNSFRSPELVGEPYGEFLLRTEKGAVAYLSAFDSKEFLEMGGMLDECLKDKNISELGRAKILHYIFGIACDLAQDGGEYKIGRKNPCPKCGSNKMHSWKPVYPLEIVEMDVNEVTHQRWDALTKIEKQQKIQEASGRVLLEKNALGIL